MVGQNPMAQTIQAAAMAHINEHIAFAYRKQMEEQIGVPLPDMTDDIPKDEELQISRLAAQAAEQLLQKNQAETAQQQAQQMAQDPLIQMQQQELQLKAQEVQIKAEKTQADIEAEKARLQIEIMRIQADERKSGAQIGAKAEFDKIKLQADRERAAADMQKEGIRMGIDAAKAQDQARKQRGTQQPKE